MNSDYPPPIGMRKKRKRNGIIKRMDGSTVRFALDRKDGLRVRRGRRRRERIISFQDLLDFVEGQFRMSF